MCKKQLKAAQAASRRGSEFAGQTLSYAYLLEHLSAKCPLRPPLRPSLHLMAPRLQPHTKPMLDQYRMVGLWRKASAHTVRKR